MRYASSGESRKPWGLNTAVALPYDLTTRVIVGTNWHCLQYISDKMCHTSKRAWAGAQVTQLGCWVGRWTYYSSVTLRKVLTDAVVCLIYGLKDTATCVTRRTSNIFGDRCFAAAGPPLWNSLPINLRQCRSLEQFKRLKTFLFSAWGHGTLWYFT